MLEAPVSEWVAILIAKCNYNGTTLFQVTYYNDDYMYITALFTFKHAIVHSETIYPSSLFYLKYWTAKMSIL